MLPSPKLKPYYKNVTWLFVTRNFKQDAKDREAARTHDRFGITSWPHLICFDPRNDEILAEMPRKLKPFEARIKSLIGRVPKPSAGDAAAARSVARARALRAVSQADSGKADSGKAGAGKSGAGKSGAGKAEAGKAEAREALRLLETVAKGRDGVGAWLEARELIRVWSGGDRSLVERLEDPDVRERAIAVEEIQRAAKESVAHLVGPVADRLFGKVENIIVRLRALEWLKKVAPRRIADHAGPLLQVPNDAFRYGVLEVLALYPRPKLNEAMAEMFVGAGDRVPSRNPNVLRGRLASALARSGGVGAVDAMAGMAREANPRNGTTRTVLSALASIAKRDDAARARAIAVLLESFPTGEDRQVGRMISLTRHHAATVHKALQQASGEASLPPPPQPFTDRSRAAYLEDLGARLRKR